MTIKAIVLASAIALGASVSHAAEIAPGMVLGTSASAVEMALKAQGYSLREFESESGRIEVKATRDGQIWEMYVDPASGQVTKLELDDD